MNTLRYYLNVKNNNDINRYDYDLRSINIKNKIKNPKLLEKLTLDEWISILDVDDIVKTQNDNLIIYDYLEQLPPIEIFTKFVLFQNPIILDKVYREYKIYKQENNEFDSFLNMLCSYVCYIYKLNNFYKTEIYNDIKFKICNITNIEKFIDLNNIYTPNCSTNVWMFVYLYTYKGDKIINTYLRENKLIDIKKHFGYNILTQIYIRMQSKYGISDDKSFCEKWIDILNNCCVEETNIPLILYRGQHNCNLTNKGFISLTSNFDVAKCSDFVGKTDNKDSCIFTYNICENFPLIKIDNKENIICRNLINTPIEYEYLIPTNINVNYTLIDSKKTETFPYNHLTYNVTYTKN
jgi:hypothetical protein